MKLLICGGTGFIGSNFIIHHLKNFPQDQIINVDNLNIGSNIENLKQVENNKNYQFIKEDIKNIDSIKEIQTVDAIVNFAAETHVDRSISNPKPFIDTNVFGTFYLLEFARKNNKKFIHVSTDEIYGEAKEKSFTENDILHPSNPYSATKASADHLVEAYHRTYGLECVTTRCTNNFGPYQFPEKLIPKTIIRAMKDLKIPLYGGGDQIRSWIYVIDHVEAVNILISRGESGQVYNITAWNEISNRTLVEKILKIMQKPFDLIESVGDRPGHDRKYSIDASKIERATGWKPRHEFEDALKKTIQWYQDNIEWWKPLADEKTLHPQPWTLKWE